MIRVPFYGWPYSRHPRAVSPFSFLAVAFAGVWVGVRRGGREILPRLYLPNLAVERDAEGVPTHPLTFLAYWPARVNRGGPFDDIVLFRDGQVAHTLYPLLGPVSNPVGSNMTLRLPIGPLHFAL